MDIFYYLFHWFSFRIICREEGATRAPRTRVGYRIHYARTVCRADDARRTGFGTCGEQASSQQVLAQLRNYIYEIHLAVLIGGKFVGNKITTFLTFAPLESIANLYGS